IPEPRVQGGRFQWVSGTSVKTFAPARQSGNQNAISIGSRNVWSNLEHRRDLSWIRECVPLFVRHDLIDQAMHVIYFAFEVAQRHTAERTIRRPHGQEFQSCLDGGHDGDALAAA